MRAASTSCVSKPGSTLLNRMKLLTNRPAPTSSTRASVTSPTASVLRTRPSPPVAHGAPSRHLAGSRGGTSQQQVGAVGAGDKQHPAHSAQQNEQWPAHVADPSVPEQGDVEAGVEHRSPAAGRSGGTAGAAGAGLTRLDSLPPATRARVAGAEARREQLDVADHTLQGDAGPQSRHGVEEVHAAVRFGLRIL